MINHYGGFTAYDIMYDAGGHLVDPNAERQVLDALTSGEIKDATDLIIISHGWNNNTDEARALYGAFFASVRSVLATGAASLDGRKLAVVSIFWPSKRFTDAGLIPGGAASATDTLEARLNAQLDEMLDLFSSDPTSAAKIQHARDQIAKLDVSQSAQDDFVFALKSLLPAPRGPRDEGLDDAREELDSPALPGHVVLQRLSVPVMPVLPTPTSGSAASLPVSMPLGSAVSVFGNFLGGVKAAASDLANLFTYYTMKDRAGIVGTTGVVQTIERIMAARSDLSVHLVGHSFGGRLVTAAASALTGQFTLSTMTLLEAAYSHNGLAKQWDGQHDGAFRGVLSQKKISGSILITHSVHDVPVGMAYPLASRLMDQVASALVGGPDDKYGGMGRNGAQHTPEATSDTLHPVGNAYGSFPNGTSVRNLNGDGPPPAPTITSHGDVAKPEIAYAMLTAM